MKQSLFMGLGAACLARDKVEQFAADVSKRAEFTEAQAKEFREDLVRRGEEARKTMEAEIDRRIDHAFIQLGIVRADVTKKGEEAVGQMRSMVHAQTDAALDRLGLARKEDVQALMARIDLLERKLAEQSPPT